MIETEPIATVQFATETATVLAQGPPSGLPEAVPDFVGEVLGGIRSFLEGTVEFPGGLVRDLTPGGPESAPGGPGNASGR
ncbi:hypothetical protein BRD00_01545 [Halobacteriales archaeon QS_8_69_26]|nr:MAG: hypothetical protein BRD00_01545 [Halobacteriales archaeon QS_8_69_26]